jgi:hypothetical protein
VRKENDMWGLGTACMRLDVVFVSSVPGRDSNEALFSFGRRDWKAFSPFLVRRSPTGDALRLSISICVDRRISNPAVRRKQADLGNLFVDQVWACNASTWTCRNRSDVRAIPQRAHPSMRHDNN